MPATVGRSQKARSGAAVVLIHGFWLNPAWMAPLGRRLARHGLEPWHHRYATTRHGPGAAAAGLAACVAALRARGRAPVHLVGHSLGGLVALAALRAGLDLGGGRAVLLGTPARGSAVARRLRRRGLGWLMGAMAEVLAAGIPRHEGPVEVGVIAGTLDLGAGRLLGGYDGPGDGTVALAETRLEGAAGEVALRASHLGLLFSPRVAGAAAAFLRSGRFPQVGRR